MNLMTIALLTLPLRLLASTILIPPDPFSGASTAQWISPAVGLDAPKVTPINDTTWDWWYFDVVQPPQPAGTQAAIVVIFFTATANGFNLLGAINGGVLTSVDLVQVIVTWPNGTSSPFVFNGTQASITTRGDGASGVYEGTGASFAGSKDMTRYKVEIDAGEMGIVGAMELQSVAPAHYACGPATAGQDMRIGPHIGWANAVPDARAHVDFSIRGEKISFTGVGYHDKNWGDQEFAKNVDFWYWGHGRLGEYSVVWFDYRTPTGEHTLAAYVSKRNQILVAQCAGITIRPVGEGTTYPPTLRSAPPTGFHVSITVPDGALSFNVSILHLIAGRPSDSPYARWTGSMSGRLNGGDEIVGEALFEQFVYSP